MAPPRLTVVGSINLDLVVRAERLPQAGETVGGASLLARSRRQGSEPGRRGGAARSRGRAGRLRRRRRVRGRGARGAARGGRRGALAHASRRRPGIALITVDGTGETTIVVAPGANAELRPEDRRSFRYRGRALPAGDPGRDGRAGRRARAPLLPQRRPGARRRSRGRGDDRQPARARGARRKAADSSVSRSAPRAQSCSRTGRRSRARSLRAVEAVDGTGAGDAFTACLVVSLLEGRPATTLCGARASPVRSRRRVSVRKARSRPRRRWTRFCEHEDRHRLRPRPRRRDGDPARARVARGRADRRHDRRGQPDARQDDAQRARHARDRRPHATSRSSAGADAPLQRDAAHRGPRPRRERASTGPSCPSRPRSPLPTPPTPRRVVRAGRRARSHRAAHERRALDRAPTCPTVERIVWMGGAIARGTSRRPPSSTRSSTPRRRRWCSRAGSRSR